MIFQPHYYYINQFDLIQEDLFYFAKNYFISFNKKPHLQKPLVLSGPPGVGKGTLLKMLLKELGD